MKIAYAIPAFLPARGFGGPQYHVHIVAEALQIKGHSTVVYTSNLASPSDFSQTLVKQERVNSVCVKRYPVVCRIAGYWVTPSMLVDLERDEYDIIHAHLGRSFQCDLAALASKLKHKPFVITAHGSIGSHLYIDRGRRIRTLHIAHNLFAASVFNAADRVIALNQFEKQELLRIGVECHKIAVIPNGVSTEEFAKTGYNFKKKHGINGRIVLFVGRLDVVKGLDTLIRAFHSVKRRDFQDAKLVMVGEDSGFKRDLLKLCEQYNILKDILLLDKPSREDIVSALHASEIFVLPSYYETFSIAMLEALACAKPIVATAVGGLPEMVAEGVNGLLVRPQDSAGLSESIMYLLDNKDLAEKMGSAGRELVTSQFSIEKVADEIESVYKDLVA